jgi:hypothetical protein
MRTRWFGWGKTRHTFQWYLVQPQYPRASDTSWRFNCGSAVSNLKQVKTQNFNTAVDNTTEAYNAGSLTPAPGIWMAIYDPEFDIRRMVADGQVYTSLFDANSHTAVNIGLVQYKYINRTSNYRYGTWPMFIYKLSTKEVLQMFQLRRVKTWILCAILASHDGFSAITLWRYRYLVFSEQSIRRSDDWTGQ